MAIPFQKSPPGQSGWNARDVEEVETESMWDGGEVMGRPSGR